LMAVARNRRKVEVDAAKERLVAVAHLPELAPDLAAFVADVCREARKNGVLDYRHVNTTYCRLCKRSDGYWPVRRSSRYKRKGEPDRDNPKTFAGKDLAQRFVVMQGHATLGGCDQCIEAARPHLLAALADIPCEVPQRFTGEAPRFKKHRNAVCTACGWTGHEGQMGKLRTMMGDGWYPGECPQCHAKNEPLGRRKIDTDESKNGFTVEEVACLSDKEPA
jgi:hypothetical protein